MTGGQAKLLLGNEGEGRRSAASKIRRLDTAGLELAGDSRLE